MPPRRCGGMQKDGVWPIAAPERPDIRSAAPPAGVRGGWQPPGLRIGRPCREARHVVGIRATAAYSAKTPASAIASLRPAGWIPQPLSIALAVCVPQMP